MPGPFMAVGTSAFMNYGAYYNARLQWAEPGTRFLGFKFNNGSGNEYGWAEVTVNTGPS